ncbi:glutamate racemase [Clostridiales bacterium]
MINRNAPIGVMDAGLGGYTVVKELQAILPREDIIFYGDGKNQPYGNRSQEEILHLTRQCLDFLKEQGVKIVGVACNTISTLIDFYQPDYDFKIFSIVKAGSDDVVSMGLEQVGVLSTMFTAQSGCYSRLIHQASPGTQVYAQGCPMLARIIEDGNFDQQRINEELKNTLGHLAAGHPDLDALILGCTHFPMVLENIQKLYPQFTYFINPAATQARQMKEYLEETGGLNPDGQGTFGVYTTSDQKFYYDMTRYIGLKEPLFVDLVPAPKPLEK